ncbi:MAG: SAM-dependent methyltransferase [Proteobacteria bacterium]|nr:MAG: SAM-dependent methyltransferase [Pseudomonadota bacterium]
MLEKSLKWQETSSFILEWLKAPLVTASILPSSQKLAQHMVKDLPPQANTVIELGPGTGVFTRQLLEHGIAESSLVLIELNTRFARKLKQSYPQATIINGAAEALSHLNIKQADAVISGLPFLSMRDQQIEQILRSSFSVLKQKGVFVQFTYGYRCPAKPHILQQTGLSAKRATVVLGNFPPASVYHFRKKVPTQT